MKILILNDVFAHPITNRATYHKWLHELIKGAINIGSPTAQVVQIHEEKAANFKVFSTSAYEVLTGDKLDRAKEHLRRIILKYDIIISIEGTKVMRKFLKELNCQYILIYFSPIRFDKDVYFSVEFSSDEIGKKMEAFSIPEDYFFNLANYWKCLINEKEKPLTIPQNSALLIGQVSKDLSVWNGSEMLNLSYYEKSICEIKKRHSSILFKPHPLDKSSNISFIKRLSYVSKTDINIYRLLACNCITEVFAISSSVVEEARFWRTKSTYLFEPFFNENKTFNTFGSSLFSSSFWKMVFNHDVRLTPGSLDDRFFIRNFRNMYWSYPYLSSLNMELPRLKKGKRDKRKISWHIKRFFKSLGKILSPCNESYEKN